MNFKYINNLPELPKEIKIEIYRLVNNPITNHQSLEEVSNYLDNKISSEPNLQLNSIDKEILDKLKEFTYDSKDSLGLPMNSKELHFTNIATFDFLPVSNLIIEWVHNNITPKPFYISIQVMHGGSTVTPHIDEGRTYVYNYILDTGSGVTKFYKNGTEYEHLKAYPQTIFPFDRIQEIETIDIEKNRWHYLNVSKIHNVENIQPSQKRISLSLSYA